MEYSNSQIRELIEEYIHSERDRKILCLRLIDGVVFEKIAEIMEMSPRQIRTIVHKSEELLFKHI